MFQITNTVSTVLATVYYFLSQFQIKAACYWILIPEGSEMRVMELLCQNSLMAWGIYDLWKAEVDLILASRIRGNSDLRFSDNSVKSILL